MIKKSSYHWWVFSSRVKANHCKKDFSPYLYYYIIILIIFYPYLVKKLSLCTEIFKAIHHHELKLKINITTTFAS